MTTSTLLLKKRPSLKTPDAKCFHQMNLRLALKKESAVINYNKELFHAEKL